MGVESGQRLDPGAYDRLLRLRAERDVQVWAEPASQIEETSRVGRLIWQARQAAEAGHG